MTTNWSILSHSWIFSLAECSTRSRLRTISFCTSTCALAAYSAQRKSSACVRLKVINTATCLPLFMETAEKIALSRTVKQSGIALDSTPRALAALLQEVPEKLVDFEVYLL